MICCIEIIFGPVFHGPSSGVGLLLSVFAPKNYPMTGRNSLKANLKLLSCRVFKLTLQQKRSFCWRSVGNSKSCVCKLIQLFQCSLVFCWIYKRDWKDGGVIPDINCLISFLRRREEEKGAKRCFFLINMFTKYSSK